MPSIVFKDSCNFLQASLDSLVKNLYQLGTTLNSQQEAFPHTFNTFENQWKIEKTLPDSAFNLLLTKGYFCYEW